jgi:hypothetical protein
VKPQAGAVCHSNAIRRIAEAKAKGKRQKNEQVTVALLVILPSALLLVLWFVLVGRGLYRFGRPVEYDKT